jgi:diguanylate cyclase (GGDEF)-like protein
MPLTNLQRAGPGVHRADLSAAIDARSPPVPRAELSDPEPGGPPMQDPQTCVDLIDSAKSSLWGLLDAPADADAQAPAPDALGRVRSAALQGALALDQLQTRLSREFAARAQLEREISEARAALAHARTELAGTRAQELQARYQASHDALTRLPNRTLFLERLAQSLGTQSPPRQGLAVLFLDLDGFKPINDAHGHAAGDELLRVVASRLARSVREADTVSRLGGDEFACILQGLATADRAAALSMKLREAICLPCRLGDRMVQVGVSIGIALCPGDGTTSEELLLKADMAMYRAKRSSAGIALYGDTG